MQWRYLTVSENSECVLCNLRVVVECVGTYLTLKFMTHFCSMWCRHCNRVCRVSRGFTNFRLHNLTCFCRYPLCPSLIASSHSNIILFLLQNFMQWSNQLLTLRFFQVTFQMWACFSSNASWSLAHLVETADMDKSIEIKILRNYGPLSKWVTWLSSYRRRSAWSLSSMYSCAAISSSSSSLVEQS